MSFLTEYFAPKFIAVQLGNHHITDIYQYIDYMRTPCTPKDPFKWGGFLEILAASLMYERPVHIHIMDCTPEFRICFV